MLACLQGMVYDDDMADFLDQLRQAIDACGLTRYRIAQESGIAESVLSRFYRGEMDLTAENMRRLTDYLGLEIVVRPKRRQKGR